MKYLENYFFGGKMFSATGVAGGSGGPAPMDVGTIDVKTAICHCCGKKGNLQKDKSLF